MAHDFSDAIDDLLDSLIPVIKAKELYEGLPANESEHYEGMLGDESEDEFIAESNVITTRDAFAESFKEAVRFALKEL